MLSLNPIKKAHLRHDAGGYEGFTRADAVLAIIEAGNNPDLRSALSQMAGGVSQPLAALTFCEVPILPQPAGR